MTESLIGAVGLKEFVFGTSFLSVILKDQDSSEAAPSSPLSISLCLTLLSLFPLSPFAAHVRFFGPCLSLSAFPSSWDSLASASAQPPSSLTGQALLKEAVSRAAWPCCKCLWPNQGSSLNLCFLLHTSMGLDTITLKTEVTGRCDSPQGVESLEAVQERRYLRVGGSLPSFIK